MDAFLVESVRSQVDAFLSEINRIQGSEFPYKHSADCVAETKELFCGHRDILKQINESTDPIMVEYACNAALADVTECLLLLGFLLRSTNVRNAFEAYGPLLRMATGALNSSDTRLVISSEWSYSPFTFIGFQHLPDSVLIGLPATESSNPLLLPLAGHELGHNAWRCFGLEAAVSKPLEMAIIEEIKGNWAYYKDHFSGVDKDDIESDLLARSLWTISYNWALNQCEEYFCDVFGLRLFGESFPHAFAYLLAPFRKSQRAPHYPSIVDRSRAIAQAAISWSIPIRKDYETLFNDLPAFDVDEERLRIMLELADRVSTKNVGILISQIDDFLSSSGLRAQSEDKITANLNQFRFRVPAENAGGISNILTAAWRARLDPELIGLTEMNLDAKTMLAEIVWKSIEIDEIEHRLATP